jgi:hypothetical protein
VVLLWRRFRDKLKRIVDSKYFNRGIMIAILVNTLSMGIEYHKQVPYRVGLLGVCAQDQNRS